MAFLRFILVSSIVLGSVVAAEAQNCDRKQSLTQSEMNDCAHEEFQRSDKKLNDLYEQIMARLAGNGPAKELLKKAQKTWIGFRDAECEFQTSASVGGSIYPMLNATCAKSLTDARSAQLKAYLSCEEGDLSCPVPQK